MIDDIIKQVGRFSLVRRATAHGYIFRTPRRSFRLIYEGERLRRSADVQSLRRKLSNIAKWALNDIKNYATCKAQKSKDNKYDNVI